MAQAKNAEARPRQMAAPVDRDRCLENAGRAVKGARAQSLS
jgi:hypothetical protein